MVDHSGHEAMFRRRFFVCLALAVPVLYYSTTLQSWLGFAAIGFTGSEFIAPAFGLLVFGYGAYRSSGWGPSRLTTGSQG